VTAAPAAVNALQDPNHRLSVPLIEAALAVMRLSTEKFFVLLSLYVAFLLFRTPPPAVARLISITARVSNAFARMVLYTFPCVCWVYGAGFVFSSLVSGELVQTFEKVRMHDTVICTMRLLLPVQDVNCVFHHISDKCFPALGLLAGASHMID
jgi:hypothetical protein